MTSEQQPRVFRLGLVVNPYAGVGGPAALKGSDGGAAAQALAAGVEQRALQRCVRALRALKQSCATGLELFGFDGEMGGDAAAQAGLPFVAIGRAASDPSTAEDSVSAAKALRTLGVDLIVFVGGDGTARDIVRGLGSDVPVLGIPAG
ncbi:MAG TPA: ATP-NAD kinase, partial [Spongiibacteraceae bacterium]|nr:ATP-NAD kinase [Spongiibacteraceae bacterium]